MKCGFYDVCCVNKKYCDYCNNTWFDDGWHPPTIRHGKLTEYNYVVLHPKNLDLGWGVDIGAFSLIACHVGVSIGDNAQIGGEVKIYSKNTINETEGKVVIGEGAKIGANSVIFPGVRINEGELIKAGSIVYYSNKTRFIKEPKNTICTGQY